LQRELDELSEKLDEAGGASQAQVCRYCYSQYNLSVESKQNVEFKRQSVESKIGE